MDPSTRHFELFRSLANGYDPFIAFTSYSYLIEGHGDMPKALQLLEHHERALHSYVRAAPPGVEPALFCNMFAAATVGPETDCLHALGPSVLKELAAFGCTTPAGAVDWYEQGAEWEVHRRRAFSSQDGLHHAHPPDAIKAILQALVSLAAAGTSRDVGHSWLDSLPAENASTLLYQNINHFIVAGARTLVAGE